MPWKITIYVIEIEGRDERESEEERMNRRKKVWGINVTKLCKWKLSSNIFKKCHDPQSKYKNYIGTQNRGIKQNEE